MSIFYSLFGFLQKFHRSHKHIVSGECTLQRVSVVRILAAFYMNISFLLQSAHPGETLRLGHSEVVCTKKNKCTSFYVGDVLHGRFVAKLLHVFIR